MRSEQEIFDDLEALCSSQGFIHAIAYICFRDNVVGFSDELKAEDMAQLYSRSCLIRTEVTTLIGLMMRAPIDHSLPAAQVLSDYIERSEALLEELHQTMLPPATKHLGTHSASCPDADQFTFGKFLREPIFYGGESAYPFQYRDLAPRKYHADSEWLLQNKSIDLEVGREVCQSIAEVLNERLIETLKSLKDKPKMEWTMLPGFVFSCDELAARTRQPVKSVRAFVEAFTVPEGQRNVTFTSLHAFNAAYAYPFIRRGPDEFLLLQYYGISEALYETPFYWMCVDEAYAPIALRHRGDFSEAFAVERLTRVFDSDRVFQNVEILKSKGETLCEIDILVLFGDRAIVLQAKSKKLTLGARKGNDLRLQGDFKAAVQDAVDQALICAELFGDPSVALRSKDGRTILLTERPRTIFPISVVADHYPALAFQARHFLKVESTERIVPPLVIDVFALDAITEMLDSPLRLLSFLSRRAHFNNNFVMSHEHMLLSYHLKHNLWLESNADMMSLADDISSDLDVAMAVRRDGIPGAATPDGILTRFEGTPFARIIAEIEDTPEPVAISLGFMLLELNEDTIRNINKYINLVLARTAADGGLHDMTIGISTASTGLTVHCSRLVDSEAEIRLRRHCEKRKYLQKVASWFGLAVRPDGSIQLAAELTWPWKFDEEMETILASTPSGHPLNAASGRKVSRNDPCPCGSGKKYKYCCIDR